MNCKNKWLENKIIHELSQVNEYLVNELIESKKDLDIANVIASDNPKLFIENCNLRALNEDMKKQMKRMQNFCNCLKFKNEECKVFVMHCKKCDKWELAE